MATSLYVTILFTLTSLAISACGTPPNPGAPDIETTLIPEGSFTMGCDPAEDAECAADETPAREIFLASFEITTYEITQAQYRECMRDQACSTPQCDWDPMDRPDYPVSCVRWQQAEEFCAWAGMELPTEAQWEKAARGDDGRLYPWGDEAPDCDRANFLGCSGIRQPVGSHPGGVSPFGVHDMAGNVPEWVADWYSETYYENSPATDPGGPADGQYRVFRGGSFQSIESFLRAADRTKDEPGDFATVHLGYMGIRCSVTP